MLLRPQTARSWLLLIDALAMAAVIGFLDRMGFLGFNPSVWAYFSTLFVSARRALRECEDRTAPVLAALAIIGVTWFYIIRFIFTYEDAAALFAASREAMDARTFDRLTREMAFFGNGWFTDA